jgi:hypothetical protein
VNFFRRSDSLLLLPLLLCCCSAPTHAQNGAMLGQSITWQPARSPFTPDASSGAIMGGPGADPNPGTPMYICRARVQNSMVPGKWVQGNCNVAFGGSEQIMQSYEVAYGTARWGAYRGSSYGLVQMGRDVDGAPLYSCRVHYFASGQDYGYQPGKLVPNGTCNIPFGGSEVIQSPPFQVLYATGGGRPPVNPPYNPYPPYPYPPPYYPYPPQVQPYPPCNPSTPGVIKDLTTGWWVGPGCSPSDSRGRITEPKYPPGQQPPSYAPPPPPYDPGPSSVTWQPAQKPFVPGSDAIMGGPGNGPKPDSPLYICRVQYNSNLFPGKWVQGECHFSDDAGKEQTSNTYAVAIGSAQWHDFDGNIGALVPGGIAVDGTPLYICRKQISSWGSKKGFQPGYLENGRCHIPYTVDTAYDPPFEALYNVFGPGGEPNPQDQGPEYPPQSEPPPQSAPPASAPAQSHGILITFASGTTATAGTITVTNGATGKTVTKPLPPNSTAQQCMEILQQAAFQAALQIQLQPDGSGLRVFGFNNAVSVTPASVQVSQF